VLLIVSRFAGGNCKIKNPFAEIFTSPRWVGGNVPMAAVTRRLRFLSLGSDAQSLHGMPQ
jgi:hypothetical protein